MRIIDQDEDVVEILVEGARAEMTAITQMNKEGDALVLRGLHLHGPGSGSSSLAELREAARELVRQQGASVVIIYGGRRTTGANPGRVPRPITIRVDQ